ncbi:MAG: SAM-dependent methyltransferase [Candidatus Cellulosilyticum pullistercoris]|uniref:SAM-dependent methyltransferase n=1 Tax=Candidatus Cellulosilyticum pullistercoris TaxID=2838521 RepID=A0A9E2NL93_9FIRM|nr:SAM-dependent methyltransferase [Candidatus Cellulosilyticum pullistercoris]
MDEFMTLLNEALGKKTFIKCIWSNPRTKDHYQKVILKPILLKNELALQLAKTKDNKEYHENIALDEVPSKLTDLLTGFKQVQLYTTSNDYQCLINKKYKWHIKKQAPSLTAPTSLSHNRQKQYILDTTSSQDFLKALGLMDEKGQIKPSKYDKYKQINRYLEFVSDCTSYLDKEPIRIIDFGCGKSYLTFALYHYLTHILNKKVEVIGLDLKKDVIAFCEDLARKLGYTHLHFQVGDIGTYTTDQPIDMVVSLHACNTATDAALEKAVGWGAKVILAVPCCHHEAYTQINNDTLSPILKHGILKERIAALVTDGLRAQLLESCGYEVSVMEFIDMAHTPKNILIKALLKRNASVSTASYDAYCKIAKMLHLDLTLERSLKSIDKL